MRKLMIGAAALALSACSVEMPLLDRPAQADAPAMQATAPAQFPDIAGDHTSRAIRAAAATCLSSRANLHDAVAQFRGAGWTVTEFAETFQLNRTTPDGAISGTVDPVGGGCDFGSTAISIYEARAIARDIARKMYPGANEGLRGACEGYRLRDASGPVTLSYGGATPSAPCPDPNGASIILRGKAG